MPTSDRAASAKHVVSKSVCKISPSFSLLGLAQQGDLWFECSVLRVIGILTLFPLSEVVDPFGVATLSLPESYRLRQVKHGICRGRRPTNFERALVFAVEPLHPIAGINHPPHLLGEVQISAVGHVARNRQPIQTRILLTPTLGKDTQILVSQTWRELSFFHGKESGKPLNGCEGCGA